MATSFLRLRQQRPETGLPSESPSVLPLQQLLDREVLLLPWIQFKSLTVIILMTLLSLQTRL